MKQPYWVGWNNIDNHDKIWGFIVMDINAVDIDKTVSFKNGTPSNRWPSASHFNDAYVFWGARGKAMQFKKDEHSFELLRLMETKIRKGYKEYTGAVENIWPGFENELSQLISLAVLTGKTRK